MMSSPAASVRTPWYRSLFAQLVVCVLLGILIGALWPGLGKQLKPLADAFIKLIKMIIAPLIFCVVVNGIAGVGNAKAVGRIGVKAIIYFEVVTTFALVFGMAVADLLKPGRGFNIDPEVLAAGEQSLEKKTGGAELPHTTQFLLNIIPDSVVKAFAENTLLAVLLFACLFGISLSQLPAERTREVRGVIEQFTEVLFKLMGYIMRVAPLGALGAMSYIIGQYGLRTLGSFGKLILCCYLAAALFAVVLWAIARFYAKVDIWRFVVFCKDEFLLALGTASTEAVMPRIMTKLVQSGNSQAVTGLVVPTGYSFNLDGATIYLAICSIFLAQGFGVDMTLTQQLTMIGVLMLTSKGMAGVPGSSFLALSATATALGIYPVAGVALLLGADRIMDSMRVFVNLLGNCVATFVVSRSERALDYERMQRAFAGHPDDFDAILEADLAAQEAQAAGGAQAGPAPA
ncbi:cation:dicarboxylate symporter family transporter [Luteococcus peritonei]|uniref:Cation:dicarboxylate symporter family transporter n=1 Tax=Luteococcus peritonei TaxID=88874 RepID=A0ABW4RWP8_9ACTN